MTLFINGRFLTQPLSGVQRYAHELLGALDARLSASPVGRSAVVLVPEQVAPETWRVLRTQVVAGGRGHIWEQGALFRASRGGVLLSLGNSGPLRHPRHVLALHDANIYHVPEAFSPRYRMAHKMLRPLLARRAARLITVSQFSAHALGRYLGVPGYGFTVVPNSAEHILRARPDPQCLARHRLTPQSYLLTVGNQSPNKNLGRLVAAFGKVRTDLRLVIAGGAAPGLAPADPEGPANADRVHRLGRVNDAELRSLIENAAGFVFPSLYEGFGIPPLEAMELGTPVLSSRSSAMPEVLGDAALWFDPRDIGDIAARLQDFVQLTPAHRAELRTRGLARARQFRWAQSAEILDDVLMSLNDSDRRVAA